MTNGEYARRQAEDYIAFLKRRGRKDTSLSSYQSVIRKISEFLDNQGFDTRAEYVSEDAISSFIHDYDCSEKSRRYYLFVYGGFLKHYDNHVIDDMSLLWNPTPSPNARWCESEQFNRMLSAADWVDRMILILGAYGGLRRAEIANLRDEDIEKNRIIIHGKGHGKDGKIRIIPLSKKLSIEIENYRKIKNELLKNGRIDESAGYLIVSEVGTRLRRCAPITIGRHVRALAERCGIDITTHSLRRMFATAVYDSTDKDIKIVQSLLGHASVTTTAKYIKKDDDVLLDAMSGLEY